MDSKNDELLDRERLHVMQQFTLNRESQEIREELYEYMIMSVIFRHGDDENGLDASQVHRLVKNDFHLSKMPSMQLKDGIQRLTNKQYVHEIDYTLKLSKKIFQKFKQGSNEIENLEKKVLNELKKELTEKLSPELHYLIEIIIKNFDNFMSEIFRIFGFQAAQVFSSNSYDLNQLDRFVTFSDFYEYADLKSIPNQHKIEFENILHEFFINPTKDRSSYFFSISQSYVLTHILNVEPDLKKIQIKLLSKKRVYLDTNVIINLLFHSTPSAESISELIDETKKLKLKLIITEKTVFEFKTWLAKQEKRLKKFKLPSSKLAEALGDFDSRDDQVLSDYSKELKKDPNLNSKKYCRKFYQVETLLSNKFGVTVEQDDKNLENLPDFKKLQKSVSEHANGSKNDIIAFHDAYCMMRVRQLRATSGGDEIGPSAWFLSTDTTLTPSEKEIFPTTEIPSTILLDSWFQIISTFISPLGAVHKTSIAFAKFLSSYFDSKKLKVNDYLNFVDALTDDSDFTLDQLKKIVGNDFIKQKLRRINQNRENDEIPTSNEIQMAVAEMQKLTKNDFTTELEKIRKDTTKKVEDEIKRANRVEKENKSFKNKAFTIISALGMVIVSIILDLTVFNYAFTAGSSDLIPILGFNLGLILGVPKLIHFLLTAD